MNVESLSQTLLPPRVDMKEDPDRDQEEEEGRRYALLLAAKDSDYVRKIYGGYLNVFVEAFGEEGDQWDQFRVVEGDFPAAEELHKYSGFVISGSPHDAYANDVWILKLCLLVQTLHAMQKKVLGICFGHQVLSRALGGRVARARNGWDLGIRKVSITEDHLSTCKLFHGTGGNIPHSLSIIECHQDEVWEIPLGAEVIASSEKTAVEMFSVGDHVVGIQGHPEYTKDILYNIIDRLVNNHTITSDFAEEAKANVEASEPDGKFWEKVCRNFLNGRYIETVDADIPVSD